MMTLWLEIFYHKSWKSHEKPLAWWNQSQKTIILQILDNILVEGAKTVGRTGEMSQNISELILGGTTIAEKGRTKRRRDICMNKRDWEWDRQKQSTQSDHELPFS